MASTVFTIDEGGISELFSSPQGDVYKHMQSQAKKIVLLAKRYVGKRTHRLEQSIGFNIYRLGSQGVYFVVEAKNSIAFIHHQGSRPHVIVARPGRALRFKDRGRVVYARAVVHPGTRPNPYLVTALREVIR